MSKEKAEIKEPKLNSAKLPWLLFFRLLKKQQLKP